MANRSPNYPSVGLTKAIHTVEKLWRSEKRSPFPALEAAKSAGYTSISGASRSFLAGIRKYGLFEDEGKEFLRLSPLAINIVAHPDGSVEKQKAVIEAALNPEIFRELIETFRESSDGSIRAYLITQKGFSDGSAKALIRAFRDTLRFSGLDNPELNPFSADDRLDTELDDEATADDPRNDQSGGGLSMVPKVLTLPSGIMFKASVEMDESGKLDVRFAGVSTKKTIGLLNEIYQLCEKYDPVPETPTKA